VAALLAGVAAWVWFARAGELDALMAPRGHGGRIRAPRRLVAYARDRVN
jgi:hypothetical protein